MQHGERQESAACRVLLADQTHLHQDFGALILTGRVRMSPGFFLLFLGAYVL